MKFFKHFLTIYGLLALVAWWLLVIFKLGNPELEYTPEIEAFNITAGVVGIAFAWLWIQIVYIIK